MFSVMYFKVIYYYCEKKGENSKEGKFKDEFCINIFLTKRLSLDEEPNTPALKSITDL